MNEVDIARLAAFIDGEGCITIQKRKSTNAIGWRFQLTLFIVNTDPRLPVWCKEKFGGNLTIKRYKKHNPNSRLQFVWQTSGINALEIIEKCLPYFVIKREQADVAIEFSKVSKANEKRASLEELRKKEVLRITLSELKWKEYDAGYIQAVN